MLHLRHPVHNPVFIWTTAISLLLVVAGGRQWLSYEEGRAEQELKRVNWLHDQVDLARRVLASPEPVLTTRLAAGLSTENTHLQLSAGLAPAFGGVRTRLQESLALAQSGQPPPVDLPDRLARTLEVFQTQRARVLLRHEQTHGRLQLVVLTAEILLVGLALLVLASRRAEQEGADSRFAHSPNPRLILDEAGTILAANQAAADRLGASCEGLRGRPLQSIISSPEDQKRLSLSRIRQGSQSEFILPLKTAAGATWESRVRSHISPALPGQSRRIDLFLQAPVDGLVRSHLDELPIPVFSLDLNGRYVEAADAMLRMIDCSGLEELNELGHDATFITEVFRERHRPGVITHVPHVLLDGAGEALPVRVTLRAADTRDGPVVRGFMSDASELAAAQRDLVLREKEFQALYDRTPVMMYAVDAKGSMTSVNQFWLDAMGYERHEVIGQPSLRHYVYEGEKLDFLENVINAKPGTRTVNVQMRTKTGRLIDGALDYSQQLDEQGRFAGATACILDLTIERQIARERDRLAEQLSLVAANDQPPEAAAS